MKTAFVILRVSEETQYRGYGIDEQAQDVQAYLLLTDLCEVGREVMSEESTTWDRPKFEALIDRIIDIKHCRSLDAVVFPYVDRLARKWDAFAYFLGKLRRAGLELHFVRENLVTSDDPMTSVMLFLHAAKAHADADAIRSNTTRGRRLRAERDNRMPSGGGGQKWAFDYHRYSLRDREPPDERSGRYTSVAINAAWLRKCAQWILVDGVSLNECCRRLDAHDVPTCRGAATWTRSVLRRILSDPALIGRFYAYRRRVVRDNFGTKRVVPTDPSDWILVYEDPSEAILSVEEWEAIQVQLKRNQLNSPRHAKHWYPPLRGLVVCATCQRRMVGRRSKDIPYYRCEVCRNAVNAKKLWDDLRTEITAMLLQPGRLVPNMKKQWEEGKTQQKHQETLDALLHQRKQWQRSRDKARRLYLFPGSAYERVQYLADDYRMQQQIENINNELLALEQQIDDMRQAKIDEKGVRRFCEHAACNLGSLSDAKWRLLLECMRMKVIVQADRQIVVHLALPTLSQLEDDIALSPSP